jgi:hypothetical protein
LILLVPHKGLGEWDVAWDLLVMDAAWMALQGEAAEATVHHHLPVVVDMTTMAIVSEGAPVVPIDEAATLAGDTSCNLVTELIEIYAKV